MSGDPVDARHNVEVKPLKVSSGLQLAHRHLKYYWDEGAVRVGRKHIVSNTAVFQL